MSQSKERHSLYVSLQRKIQKEYPEWEKEKVNEEVKTRLTNASHRSHSKGSQDGSQRFTQGSQAAQNLREKPPKIPGTSSLSNFGILYRKKKNDFTLVFLVGEKYRPLRSLKTGVSRPIPELGGLRIIRDEQEMELEVP